MIGIVRSVARAAREVFGVRRDSRSKPMAAAFAVPVVEEHPAHPVHAKSAHGALEAGEQFLCWCEREVMQQQDHLLLIAPCSFGVALAWPRSVPLAKAATNLRWYGSLRVGPKAKISHQRFE